VGLGTLVSAALVQIAWEPLLLHYLVLLGLVSAVLAATFYMPEPVALRSPFRLTVQRPRVPPDVRRPFRLAALAVLSSWSIGALFFSLGPQLAARIFKSSSVLVSALGVVALAIAAVLAQLLAGRGPAWIAACLGSIALAAGMTMIIVASATDSGAVYLAGSFVAGVGFGAVYLGGLRSLMTAIPAKRRAAVMAAFFVVAYSSLSLPAIFAGVVVTQISLQATFEIFGAIVIAIAFAVAFEAWRLRGASEQEETTA